jgi:2-methylcitrate dehydratase PrpD
MTSTPSAELAGFIANLSYDDLPASVRERVKDYILDAIGSALAGQRGDEVRQIRALATALGSSEEASVIGGDRLTLAGATMLNAYLVTAVTVCDVHRPTLYHTTPEVVPPALAIAERDGGSGKALLLAVAAGLETSVRIALGIDYPAFRARGWHSPGVVGPFGGASALGKLLGLNTEQQRNAFGLAGSQSAGTFAHWGTPTIKFHQCRGALSGLLAGLLAQQDFRASAEILAHPDGGIFNAYSDGGKPEIVDTFTRERIQVVMDPTLQGTAAVVEVRTSSGQTFTDRRTCAKGDPDDPLTRAEIQDKLRTAAVGLLTREKVERTITLLDRLEDLADVRELTAALRK